MMTYYQLLFPDQHKNIIVRAEGRSQQQYVAGKGWIESGIMMRYFNPESEFYGEYKEISEQEALSLVSQSS